MAKPWFFEVFPYRPPPYPGECLSGYLLRLAQGNGFGSFWEFATRLFPWWQGTQKLALLRWEYPVEEWGQIPLRTQLSVADLRALSVAPWLEKFRPPLDLRPSSYLSPGNFLRGLVEPALRICPQCLQEQPYLRLLWRLTPVQACLRHGSLLQGRCHRCGTPLTLLGVQQQHLRCATCDLDLAQLPPVQASAELLAEQHRRQADLPFLLDPGGVLVARPDPRQTTPDYDPRPEIGLKFRYLRLQAGQSVAAMAQRLGAYHGQVTNLELGTSTPLAFYLAYLEALSYSWPDFAALEVPHDFVRNLQNPPHLSLRLCPTPGCPNHFPPPSIRVHLLADLPARQVARFRCTACGRSFTRTYDGRLTTKPRKPPIRPGEAPPMVKPAAEIAHLVEMGLQGEDNRRIAHCLGWGEKTVRIHWISLGLEEQVHRAQAQRRAWERRQRESALQARLDRILPSLLAQGEEITLAQVNRTLGQCENYVQNFPALAGRIQEVLVPHNAQVRQRHDEVLAAKLAHALQELKQSPVDVAIPEIARQMGLTYNGLVKTYPELHARVCQAVAEHRAELKAARQQRECEQVNEAAVRLIAQGISLSYRAILAEAGLDKYRAQCDPAIRDLLRQWIGDFPPRV